MPQPELLGRRTTSRSTACASRRSPATTRRWLAAAKGELDWFGSFLPDIEKTYVAHRSGEPRILVPGRLDGVLHVNFESDQRGQQEGLQRPRTSATPSRWRWTGRRWSISRAMATRRSTNIRRASARHSIPGTIRGRREEYGAVHRLRHRGRQGAARRGRLQGRRRRRVRRDAGRPADQVRHHRAERLDRLGQLGAARGRRADRRSASSAKVATPEVPAWTQTADRRRLRRGDQLAFRAGVTPHTHVQPGAALAQQRQDALRSAHYSNPGAR